MTQQLPWNDGSGDMLTFSCEALSGNQVVTITSDVNKSAVARSRTVSFSYLGTGGSPVVETLTLVQAGYKDVVDGYRRLTGIHFDGNVYYDTEMRLYGSDTLRFAFRVSKACNVLGCYTSASAQTNYSLYASTTSGAKYTRYNGGTYSSYVRTNVLYEVVISPTGTDGMQTDSSWSPQTFTTESDLMIGTTSYEATSAKLTGDLVGDLEVDGRAYFMAVERISDGEIGYLDTFSGRFFLNLGTGTPVALGYV